MFYVRNHLPVPDVDMKSYSLEISGLGVKSKTFTMDELKKLPKHTVTAAIQCAGNRRSEMSEVNLFLFVFTNNGCGKFFDKEGYNY